MLFSQVPGLSELKQKLTQSVQDAKVPHALLFQGKEGALNLPLALAFSTYLHCENRSATDSCGTCAACTLNKKWVHPDTHFSYPAGNMKTEMKETDGEKVRIEILKLWREFLQKEPFGTPDDWISYYGGEDKQPIISKEDSREIIKSMVLKPFQSKVKIIVIWQPEMMHTSASNAILKVLEEPPPHTYFLLITNHVGQLLPTILSRTQIVTVPLSADADIRTELEKRGIKDTARIDRALGLAAGDLQAALRIVDDTDGPEQQTFQDFMRSCFRLDPARLIPMSEQFHAADRMDQRNLLIYGLAMLRETIVLLSGAEPLLRARGGEQEFLRKFSSVMTVRRIETVSRLFNESLYQLERNGSAKMIFMDLALSVNKAMKE